MSCEALNTVSVKRTAYPSLQRSRKNQRKRGRTSDHSLKHESVHRLSRSNRRRPAVMSADGDQFTVLHVPQRHLFSLEREVHQRVVVWDL